MPYDVGEIQARARAAWKLAPSPASTAVLVYAAASITDKLIEEWQGLPVTVRNASTASWFKPTMAYRIRLEKYAQTVSALLDHIESGDTDWQSGIEKGSAYAKTLEGLFSKKDASRWAFFANKLAALNPPVSEGISWAKKVLQFTGAGWAVALDDATGSVTSRSLGDMATDTANALKSSAGKRLAEIGDAVKRAGKFGVGVALAAGVVGVLVYAGGE